MLVEATAAKDPARFHSVDKICAHHDKQIIWLVVMRNSQSPPSDNLAWRSRSDSDDAPRPLLCASLNRQFS